MIVRSKLIETSLSCLYWGMASLLPVLGFFAAFPALLKYRAAVVETRDRWNPARLHLYAGMFMAVGSLLLHAVVAFIIYLNIIRGFEDG